jgi:hypothetical protein
LSSSFSLALLAVARGARLFAWRSQNEIYNRKVAASKKKKILESGIFLGGFKQGAPRKEIKNVT